MTPDTKNPSRWRPAYLVRTVDKMNPFKKVILNVCVARGGSHPEGPKFFSGSKKISLRIKHLSPGSSIRNLICQKNTGSEIDAKIWGRIRYITFRIKQKCRFHSSDIPTLGQFLRHICLPSSLPRLIILHGFEIHVFYKSNPTLVFFSSEILRLPTHPKNLFQNPAKKSCEISTPPP